MFSQADIAEPEVAEPLATPELDSLVADDDAEVVQLAIGATDADFEGALRTRADGRRRIDDDDDEPDDDVEVDDDDDDFDLDEDDDDFDDDLDDDFDDDDDDDDFDDDDD